MIEKRASFFRISRAADLLAFVHHICKITWRDDPAPHARVFDCPLGELRPDRRSREAAVPGALRLLPWRRRTRRWTWSRHRGYPALARYVAGGGPQPDPQGHSRWRHAGLRDFR